MTALRKLIGSVAIAGMLAASSAPALARPGYGWGHGGWGGYGRYGRYHDGDAFGGFLLGALLVGGIAAIASSSARNSGDANGVVYGGNGGYAPEPAPAGPAPQDPRNWSDAENAAADACADGAEALASKRGAQSRVDNIDSVEPDGEEYHVEGRMEGGRPFACGVRHGEVSYIQFDSRVAWR